VPADLDQFGRDYSHCAIVGGKCLVKLGHHSAYGRGFFSKVDEVSGICQIQGRLHPGDASAYYQDRSLECGIEGVF